MKKWVVVSIAVNILLILALLYGRQYTKKMVTFSMAANARAELQLVNTMLHLLKEGQSDKAVALLEMMSKNGAQIVPQLADAAKNIWLPFAPQELREMIDDAGRTTAE